MPDLFVRVRIRLDLGVPAVGRSGAAAAVKKSPFRIASPPVTSMLR